MRYVVVYEETGTGWSAYVPDLCPGAWRQTNLAGRPSASSGRQSISTWRPCGRTTSPFRSPARGLKRLRWGFEYFGN